MSTSNRVQLYHEYKYSGTCCSTAFFIQVEAHVHCMKSRTPIDHTPRLQKLCCVNIVIWHAHPLLATHPRFPLTPASCQAPLLVTSRFFELPQHGGADEDEGACLAAEFFCICGSLCKDDMVVLALLYTYLLLVLLSVLVLQ